MQETTQCARCILPASFPGISFDRDGVCNFCRAHTPSPVRGEVALAQILHSARGERYDCVVPISGGKDSAYILYYAVRVLGLRAVAANYDSGFQSSVAAQNVVTICHALDVPLVVHRAKGKTQEHLLREALHVSAILGNFFGTCLNCEVNIRTVAMNTAREIGAPFVLHGASQMEDIGRHAFLGPGAFLRRVHASQLPRLALHIARYCYYDVRQRIEMRVPLRQRFLPLAPVPFPERAPTVVRFFDYVAWDSLDKLEFLRETLGWESAAGHAHRFDCLLHCLGNRKWIQDSGISNDGYAYSTMIREGRVGRETALDWERAIQAGVEAECREVCEQVGLEDYVLPGSQRRGDGRPEEPHRA
jgi:hypothetical protein